MIKVLSKPADQVGHADVQELIDSQVPEGQEIEYKESLPTDDGSPDRWVTHGDRIGRRAKHTVLEESVAFANAYSGALVLGIAESSARPPVAERIRPIPRCVDLAERLKLVFRDGVEPQIPSLKIFAVPTDGASGVVIVRVGKSRMAPHRVASTRHCTIRRSDRCEKMSMREIQDLTLNTSRGLERMERRLAERAKAFRQGFERLRAPENAYGIRVTAAPVGDEIMFNRVYGQKELYRPKFEISILDRYNVIQAEDHSLWRPMLRAARADTSAYGTSSSYSYEEIACDGLVEKASYASGSTFLLGKAVIDFASVAVWVDHVRTMLSTPVREYAIDVEINAIGQDLIITAGSSHRRFQNTFVHDEIGRLDEGRIRFPLYPMSDSNSIEELLTLFEQDLWDAIGKSVRRGSFRLEYIEESPKLIFDYDNQE